MTRKEIEELRGLAASMGLYDDENPYKRAVILGKAIQELKQEPRWISVKERLPEEHHAVLVYCTERKNAYCAYLEENQWWIFGAYREKITEEIVAWMPLPEPYREVEE